MKTIKLLCSAYQYRGYRFVLSDYDESEYTTDRYSKDAVWIFKLLVSAIPSRVFDQVLDLVKAWKRTKELNLDKFLEKQNLKPHGDNP